MLSLPAHSKKTVFPLYILLMITFVAIALGLFFRFSHLGQKVFWDDEIYTLLRVLGLTEDQVISQAATAHTAGDLQAILHPATISGSMFRTVQTLAMEEPQHAPLFYVLARAWVLVVGTSIGAMRALSAFIGLLALPAMYLACREIYGSGRAALIGVTLLAVSPVQIVYSQEFREYVLWGVALLLMTAALLRALRMGTHKAWGTYAATVTFALYVFPLTLTVLAAHACAVAALNSSRPRLALVPAAWMLAGAALFLPWLILILSRLGQVHKGMGTIVEGQTDIIGVFRSAYGLIRMDVLDFSGDLPFLLKFIATFSIVAMATLGIWWSWRRGYRAQAAITAATVLAVLPFTVGADMVWGGQRTMSVRYFIPFYIGLHLALVGFFYRALETERRNVFSALLAAVLLCMVATCVSGWRAETGWAKLGEQSIALARLVNREQRPFLASDSFVVWPLTMAEYLRPDIRVQVRPHCYLCTNVDTPAPQLPDDGPFRVFLLAPTKRLQDTFKPVGFTCIDVTHCSSSLSLWLPLPKE
jgi:uncharacterized membrane protein